MRSLIHRVAAAVFMAVTVTHLVSLIVSRKLREHWKEMLPNAQRSARGALRISLTTWAWVDTPPGALAAQLYREGRVLGGGLGSGGHDRDRA